MDAIDDKGRPVDLTRLTPGEATVRVLRGTLRYPPDHIAIARANHALRNYTPQPGKYHGHAPNESQAACLTGDA